jgi:hypothetical protein
VNVYILGYLSDKEGSLAEGKCVNVYIPGYLSDKEGSLAEVNV